MFILSLLFVSNLALADAPTVSDYDKQLCRDRSEISNVTKAKKDELYNLCIQVRASEMAVDANSRAVRKLKLEKCDGGFFRSAKRGEDLKKCQDENERLMRENLTAIDAGRGLSASLTKEQAAYNLAHSDATQTSQAIQDANRNVNRMFDDMKISVFDQRLRAADSKSQLNDVSRALDNSVLGLYLRDRMAGLLSAPVMCDTVKACSSTPAKVEGKQLNDIFNSQLNMKAEDIPVPRSTPAPSPAPSPVPAPAPSQGGVI